MPGKAIFSIILLITLASLLLAGCSASSTPRLIAAFPAEDPIGEPQPPSAPAPIPQPPAQFVYNAHLQVETWYPRRAASRAEALASRHGGYLVSSHARRIDGTEHLTVVLAVPIYSFHTLYGDLKGLGKVVDERVWGHWQAYGPGGVPNYSQITVELNARAFALPSISLGGWNPARTFANALRVSVAIFTFLVDSSIWLCVVAAPLILVVIAAGFVVKKIRQQKT